MNLENKKILITAGPTWVAIDKVRVISNIASGKTGILLAEKLQSLGAQVTLLLGPVGAGCLNKKIKLIRFKFFDELRRLVIKELKAKKYDMAIHSAAVSDYQPVKMYNGKLASSKKRLKLTLIPTPKIIDSLKRINKRLRVIAFKFEPGVNKKRLIRQGRILLLQNTSDLVVANTLIGRRYLAYLVTRNNIYGPINSREGLVKNLINRL